MPTNGDSKLGVFDYTKAFFTGIIVGAVNNPLKIISGAIRLPQSLGFPPGYDSTNQVQFHDWATSKALYYGAKFAVQHLDNFQDLKDAWDGLDDETKTKAIESVSGGLTDAVENNKLWLTNQVGSFTGSYVASKGIDLLLTKKMKFPKKVTFPALMVLSFSGSMALFWKDAQMQVPTFQSTGTNYDKIIVKK